MRVIVPKPKLKILSLCLCFLFLFGLTGIQAAEEKVNREIKADDITLNSLEKGQEIIAKDNVYILYNNLEFNGGFARINTVTNQMLMEEELVVKTPDYTLKGNKLEGNLNTRNFKMTGGVQMTGNQLLVESDMLDYRHQKQEIYMENISNLTYNNLQAEADRGTFDQKQEIVYLNGNVRGVQNGRKFSADKITIEMKPEKINMKGQARLVIPESTGENEEEGETE